MNDAMHIGVMMHFTDHTATPADVAVAAEERGFESMFVTEHTHIPVRDCSLPTALPGPTANLLSASTSKPSGHCGLMTKPRTTGNESSSGRAGRIPNQSNDRDRHSCSAPSGTTAPCAMSSGTATAGCRSKEPNRSRNAGNDSRNSPPRRDVTPPSSTSASTDPPATKPPSTATAPLGRIESSSASTAAAASTTSNANSTSFAHRSNATSSAKAEGADRAGGSTIAPQKQCQKQRATVSTEMSGCCR